MKALVQVTNCQACMCVTGLVWTIQNHVPTLWLQTVLSLPGWLFRSWQSFYNLIGVDTFWSHALRHWGSPCAFSVSLPCLHLANPQPAVPSWPLHFYSCPDLFWVLLQETLLNAQQAAVNGDFWLCGIWGLWQSWRINYKYKSTPVVDCVVITKDLFQRCFLCPLMAVGLAIRFLLSILGVPTETFPLSLFPIWYLLPSFSNTLP